jgi:hypothetical protein
MKRSQASSPLQGSSPHTHKKLKVSQGTIQDDVDEDTDAGEWTKVEKRKAKKVKKTVANFDVCVRAGAALWKRANLMTEKPTSVYVCEWRNCQT